MSKKIQLIFIILGMLIMLVPFAGMIFRPTEETTENRRLAEFPSFSKKDGGLNTDFPEQFEDWFQDHFAFRNELAAADGHIQGTVFGVSSVDSVIHGTDGWLYYSSTLPDYLGTGRMNERELFNLKQNLSIVKDYVEKKGAKLVFTVPPNKNTLYGSHMPYYSGTASDQPHTMEALPELCEEIGITYADLLSAFREQGEVLYLERDSHWNGKGAMLAYRTILDAAEQPYDSYEDVEVARLKDDDGDLNRMVYSYYGEKEWNYYYNIEGTYETDAKDVEAAWIPTSAEGKEGKLLMFRDSFGNTLLPLVAGQFGEAVFSRESPYRLEKTVEEQKPDVVIIEKVERNLRDLISEPPIISAPAAEDTFSVSSEPLKEDELKLSFSKNMYDGTFYTLSGELPEDKIRTETEILLEVDGKMVHAYQTGAKGFKAYLRTDEAEIRVILKDGDEGVCVLETTVRAE